MNTPPASVDISSSTPRDVGIHLRVVGSILEHHHLYTQSRLDAVKSVVLRIFCELYPRDVSLDTIKGYLCWNGTPLVTEEVIRQAVNSIFGDRTSILVVDKKKRVYRLIDPPVVQCESSKESLPLLLDKCWERHRGYIPPSGAPLFSQAMALLFARYGCSAYDALVSHRGGADIRIEDVVSALHITPESTSDYASCLNEFILSNHPEDALLKVKLASAYAILRMNGAGNWNNNELRSCFGDKRFLLDTNVLFELTSGTIEQTSRVLAVLRDLGCELIVGRETQKEFEVAIRNSAAQVVKVIESSVDIGSLVESGATRVDWLVPLIQGESVLTKEDVERRVSQLVAGLDATLSSAGVACVYLERERESAAFDARVAEIQQHALEARSVQKHEAVAFHDALLWGAVADEPTIADTILTMDRSLGRVRVGGRRIVSMLDEVVAYALVGGAEEAEFAELFSHTLRSDLIPSSNFLSLEDIQTIARIESRLLTGPARALRVAASKIASMRAERVTSGAPVSPDEIGRILVNAIASYDDDRAAASRERERANVLETQRDQATQEATLLRETLERERAIATSVSDDARSVADRAKRLEAVVADASGNAARLEVTVEERRRIADAERVAREKAEQDSKTLRDWMLLSSLLIVVAAMLLFVWGAKNASIVVGGAAFLGMLVGALARRTPDVRAASVMLAAVVAIATIAEKAHVILAALGSPP